MGTSWSAQVLRQKVEILSGFWRFPGRLKLEELTYVFLSDLSVRRDGMGS